MNTGDESVEPVPTAILKRRARNRASQKTFRDRQARYVKELEASLTKLTRDSSDELAAARDEAEHFRLALVSTKERVLSLRGTLSAVAEEIDVSLGYVPAPRKADDALAAAALSDATGISGSAPVADDSTARSEAHAQAQTFEPTLEALMVDTQYFGGNEDAVSDQPTSGSSHMLDRAIDDTACPSVNIQGTTVANLALSAQVQPLNSAPGNFKRCDFMHWQAIPGIETGTKAFPTLLPADTPDEQPETSNLALPFPPGVINFPSVFSAHLGVIDFFAKKSTAYAQRSQVGGGESFTKLIATMVNMFVTTCWPDMCIWWTYIQSSMVVEKLMRWNLDSCLDTYKSLPVTHRPTALQLCTAHPPIIDWAFFPSVRDRMIELYSSSWMLDELVCELVHAYVVEADLSSLVVGLENLPPQKGYFRMWDIVQTISSDMQRRSPNTQRNTASWFNDLGFDDDLFSEPTDLFELDYTGSEKPWTKMPLEKIYQSSQAAWKLFKLLRMEDRRAVKIDPVFAAAHPELCDDSSIIANGIDCTLRDNSTRVPRPKPLTREAIINYKMMIWKG